MGASGGQEPRGKSREPQAEKVPKGPKSHEPILRYGWGSGASTSKERDRVGEGGEMERERRNNFEIGRKQQRGMFWQ